MTDRLYRSPTDRVIAGVAGGLATWLNLDPSLVRIAWVLLAIFTGGVFVLVYVVMMIVVPLPPPGWVPVPRGAGPGPGAAPGAGPIPGWQAGTPPAGEPAGGGWTQPPAGAAPGGYPGQPGAAPSGWGSAQPGAAPGSGPAWSTPKPANAGIAVGAVLIILGAWFLVDQYLHIPWDLVWPVMIMVLGGVLIAAAVRRRSA